MLRILLALLIAAAASPALAGRVIIDCPSITWDAATSTATINCASGPVVTPPPVDPPPTTACPSNTLWIRGQWGKYTIVTSEFGEWTNNIMVVQIDVPTTFTGTNVRTTSWVEYGAGAFQRYAALSTQPCDFSSANALKNSLGVAAISNNQQSISFKYKAGPPTTGAVEFKPGQRYYINARTLDCSIENCVMRGGLPQ